jgi:hypothetical protein
MGMSLPSLPDLQKAKQHHAVQHRAEAGKICRVCWFIPAEIMIEIYGVERLGEAEGREQTCSGKKALSNLALIQHLNK